MFTCKYASIYIGTHAWISVYIYDCMYICMSECMQTDKDECLSDYTCASVMQASINMYACKYVCIQPYMLECMHVGLHVFIYLHMYVSMYIIYIYMHVHMYVCACRHTSLYN